MIWIEVSPDELMLSIYHWCHGVKDALGSVRMVSVGSVGYSSTLGWEGVRLSVPAPFFHFERSTLVNRQPQQKSNGQALFHLFLFRFLSFLSFLSFLWLDETAPPFLLESNPTREERLEIKTSVLLVR